MTAANYDLRIEQGASYGLRANYDTDAGDPIDLRTGWTARLAIRGNINDKNYLIELTTENGGIILGEGYFDLIISSADTALLRPGAAVYDLKLMTSSVVNRILTGAAVISGEVTRNE